MIFSRSDSQPNFFDVVSESVNGDVKDLLTGSEEFDTLGAENDPEVKKMVDELDDGNIEDLVECLPTTDDGDMDEC